MNMSKLNSHLKKLTALCYQHKFIIERTVETTRGLRSFFEYGPLGAELRRNLKSLWWQDVVTSRETVQGLEMSMFATDELSRLQNEPQHRMVDVEYLTEKLLSFSLQNHSKESENAKIDLKKIILQNSVPLRTGTSTSLDRFGNSLAGSQLAMPAGYAWNAKQVSMETAENDILRSLENELLCLQFLCEVRSSKHWLNFWRRQRIIWWRKLANVPSNFSSYDVPQKNSRNVITKNQYEFSWGKEEIESISSSSNGSSDSLAAEKSKNSPLSSISITTNIDKGFIALLADAFEEKDRADKTGEVSRRTVLHIHPSLAPYKVAIYTNSTNENELSEVSHQLASELRQAGISTGSGSSTKPDGNSSEEFYAYHDEIGTPYCVTILQSTLSNGVVAFRSRDTTLQEFLHISDVLKTLQSHLKLL